MSLLIDTHILIWLLAGSPYLTQDLQATLANRRNTLLLSVASTWEIAIKVGIGKLELPPHLDAWLPAELEATGLRLLPIHLEHTLGVEALPHHHRDPFDRLLIAQAITEGLTLVTADRVFGLYDVPLIHAW